MPINFNTTFVTPLLAQLDAGTIGNGEDFATAIVDAYIATVKTGLPQNVATTLPAPGLTVPPAPTPPFLIGASAFLTADQRKKKMSSIINAYFKAKDGAVDKAAIESLKVTIQRTISSAKSAKSQIESIAAEIEIIATEVAKFPETIKDIKIGLDDEVERVKSKVTEIYESLLVDARSGALQQDIEKIALDEIDVAFPEQLAFIKTLKDFKATPESLSVLLRFIKSQNDKLKSKFGTQEKQKQTKEVMANYVNAKLMGLANHLITIAKSILDPIALLDYIKQLVPLIPSLERVYQKIVKFKFIKDALTRQFIILEQKKEVIEGQLRNYVEPKLKELRDKLADKIAKSGLKRKSTKKAELYAKSSKEIADKKKARIERQLKRKRKLEKIIKASKLAAKLIADSTKLTADVQDEFKSIAAKIEEYKALAAKAKELSKLDSLKAETKLEFKPIEYEVNFTIENSITTNIVKAISPSSARDIIETKYGKANVTINSVKLVKLTNLKLTNLNEASTLAMKAGSMDLTGAGDALKTELKKLESHFKKTGLGQYAILASAAMRTANTDFETFKKFLDKDDKKWVLTKDKDGKDKMVKVGSRYYGYVIRIEQLDKDFKSIDIIIKSIKDDEPVKVIEPPAEEDSFLISQIRSLSKLISYLSTIIEPRITKLVNWITDEMESIKESIKKEVIEFADMIEGFLKTRVPPNSKVDDIKEKKKLFADTIAVAKYKIARAKRLIAEVQLILKMAGGAIKLTSNLSNNIYRYSDNGPHINSFIDSYYDLMYLNRTEVVLESQQPPTPADIAREKNSKADKVYYDSEKKRVKDQFKPLVLIDLLIFGLIETLKDIKNSKLINDLTEYVEMVEKTANHPGKNTIGVLKEIMEVFKTPPTDPSVMISMAKKFTSGIIGSIGQDTNIVTPLAQLETKHLANSRKAIKKLCKMPFVAKEAELQQPTIDKLDAARIQYEKKIAASKTASKAELTVLNKRYKDEVEKIKEEGSVGLEGTSTAQLILRISRSLDKNQSFIMLGFNMLVEQISLFITWLTNLINKTIEKEKAKLEKRKVSLEEEAKRIAKKKLKDKVNVEALILTAVFGLSARLFWTGASWYGPTGTKHTVLNIGRFTKMDFLASSGRSGMVKEIARGFEHQLVGMFGIISPPPNTAIPPFPFKGYLLAEPVAILLAGEASANAAAGLA